MVKQSYLLNKVRLMEAMQESANLSGHSWTGSDGLPLEIKMDREYAKKPR